MAKRGATKRGQKKTHGNQAKILGNQKKTHAAQATTHANQAKTHALLATILANQKKTHRGHYDLSTIKSILSDTLVCHVAFVGSDGAPRIIPTLHAVVGDYLFLHGKNSAAYLKAVKEGTACVAATQMNGIVYAKSLFESSANYRSVIIFGCGEEIVEAQAKYDALVAFSDALLPGRSRESRLPSTEEVIATRIVRLPLTEASAKVRHGPVDENEADKGLPHWCGVLPFITLPAEPLSMEYASGPVPASVRNLADRVMERAASDVATLGMEGAQSCAKRVRQAGLHKAGRLSSNVFVAFAVGIGVGMLLARKR